MYTIDLECYYNKKDVLILCVHYSFTSAKRK